MHFLDDERVENAILIASQVSRAAGVYKSKDTFSGYASGDAIFDYVKLQQSTPISIIDVSFEGRIVGSRLERYKDRIDIAICANQDRNWKRFCAIKELVHILIDTEIDFSPYGNERIEELLGAGLIGLASGVNPTAIPTQSELVAEICAIEIMYPAEQVVEDWGTNKQDTGGTPMDLDKIAIERRMPGFYVSTALHPKFRGYIVEAFRSCQSRRES
jgi:hypothetical protein